MRSNLTALIFSLIVLAALHTITAVPVPVTDSSIAASNQPESKRQYLDGSGYYLIDFPKKNPISGEYFYRRQSGKEAPPAPRDTANSLDGQTWYGGYYASPRDEEQSDGHKKRQDYLDLPILPETNKDLLGGQDFYSAEYSRDVPEQKREDEVYGIELTKGNIASGQDFYSVNYLSPRTDESAQAKDKQQARDYDVIDPSQLSWHNAESGQDWYYDAPTTIDFGRRQDGQLADAIGEILNAPVGGNEIGGQYWGRDPTGKKTRQEDVVEDPTIVTIVPREVATNAKLDFQPRQSNNAQSGQAWNVEPVPEDIVPRQDGYDYELTDSAVGGTHLDAISGEVFYRDVAEKETRVEDVQGTKIVPKSEIDSSSP